MGFWIFMLIMELLIPLTMLGFGAMFVKTSPKNINYFFGYRTNMSMKNADTWQFAHHYCGRLWRKLGWGLLLVTAVVAVFTFGLDKDNLGTIGGGFVMGQIAVLIGSIFPTERALNRTFDRDGRRREEISKEE